MKKIKSWVKNINKNLNVKINSNHFDSYEFENNKFFSQIQNFLFFLHTNKSSLSKNDLNMQIQLNKLNKIKNFLKIFN